MIWKSKLRALKKWRWKRRFKNRLEKRGLLEKVKEQGCECGKADGIDGVVAVNHKLEGGLEIKCEECIGF